MANSAAEPGFPCPRCRSWIGAGFDDLLEAGRLRCAGCGLELAVNLSESRSALEVLEHWRKGMRQARAHLGRALPPKAR